MAGENHEIGKIVVNVGGTIVSASPSAERIFGRGSGHFLGTTVFDLFDNAMSTVLAKQLRDSLERNESFQGNFTKENTEGVYFEGQYTLMKLPTEITNPSVLQDHGEVALVLIQQRNIASENKGDLEARSNELRIMYRAAQSIVSNLELDEVLIQILDEISTLMGVAGSLWLLDGETGDLICRQASTLNREQVIGWRLSKGEGIAGWVAKNNQSVIVKDARNDPRHFVKVSQEAGIEVRSLLCVPMRYKRSVIGVIEALDEKECRYDMDDLFLLESLAGLAATAVENARLFRKATQRLSRLEVIHEVDNLLIGSLDMAEISGKMLEIVKGQTDAKAISLMYFDQEHQTFERVDQRGFELFGGIQSIPHPPVELLLDQAQPDILVSDIDQIDKGQEYFSFLKASDITGYYAKVLTVKGTVGLLELFSTKQLGLVQETRAFIDTLAGQIAVAMERIRLFRVLDERNQELLQAYDATIRGWAKALELRDMATEGHSKRVAELTVRLGRKAGIEEEKLPYVRWGALLHDIGKMGVPDTVLRKPGKLNEKEREIMEKHPIYAYKMLSEIDYLKPAMEIPVFHHARWDGMGYPQGLKREEIPLAARVFSVVDVWDALRSERPYRKAWSRKRALEYIRDQAGKQFDPWVVDVFLNLISQEYNKQ